MGYSEVVNNDPVPPGASVQPLPGPPQQSPRPPLMSFGGPGPVPIQQRPPSAAVGFPYAANPMSPMSNAANSVLKDLPPMSSSNSSMIHASASSPTNGSVASSFIQASVSTTTDPMLTSAVSTGAVPRLPGIAASSALSSSPSVSAAATGSFAPSMLRPMVPAAPHPSNPAMQPPVYPPYVAVPPAGASPQPLWLQPQPVVGMRPPYLPYPPVYSGPISFAPRGLSLPYVPVPEAQPPGVTPVGNSGGVLPLSVNSTGSQIVQSSPMQSELPPPGTDSGKQRSGAGPENAAGLNDQLDAWSAHKTEAGIVYYYNAVTGESTYEKPSGFKGEPATVTAQPTPVAWEKVAGTDWALVTTNDDKKYYYNTISQISSWQVPPEVTELRKKQESDYLKENSMPVPNSSLVNEKGSDGTSVSVPALITGGRDAIALRASGASGTASALDLVKKKLQESGAQVTSYPTSASSGSAALEINGSKTVEATVKALQSDGNKEKQRHGEGDGSISDSSSESEDEDSGPTKEQLVRQFREMLKERGVAPFSKWDRELPKIVFDPRFKAIPTYGERRSLFDHFVRTRAEEERKEKRAAQRAAVEGFNQLLEEAKEDIDHNMDYHAFRKKWGHDPRFEALDRKEREALLNERILPLKKAAEEEAQAERAAVVSNFKTMLREHGDITSGSRWSKVKDGIRDDPRYKAVKHEEREALFNEFISELKAADDEAGKVAKAKRVEQEKLRERERELRKRKEREEQEMERVRLKVRRLEAVSSYQALLVETIKDPQASWTESKPKLEKDPQGRASNPDLSESDLEKLFREHVKILMERCAQDFKALLAEIITLEAAEKEVGDGKTVLTSWSTAKRLLKFDRRYTKMLRKDREVLWKRHVEDIQRKKNLAVEEMGDKQTESKTKSSNDSGRISSVSRSAHGRR